MEVMQAFLNEYYNKEAAVHGLISASPTACSFSAK